MRQIRTGLTPILLTMIAIVVSACASQMDPDPYARRPACPGDLVLQCVERTAQVSRCTCVSRDAIQETIESIMGGDRRGGKRPN